jgi:coenzyme F420 hydrogenase subunit beta
MATRPRGGDRVTIVELPPAVPRSLCTDCGISRTSDPKACGRACQFIKPDYAALERKVHGRSRNPERPDELFFGPFRRMVAVEMIEPSPGAQWTGIVTRIGERLLETGAVDAVLAIGPDPEDRWRPTPVLITRSQDMASVRGMRMGYAPLLALLEPARDAGYRRIALIGIPCQVYALHQIDDRQQNNGSDERGQQRQRIKRVCAQAAATDQTTEQEATED